MKLTNTLTGRKEEFRPAGETVRIYVCGVTPYDTAHVGHAMSYIIFDTLRRYLEYAGYSVRHVQNFTDIDDKIIARAAVRNESPRALAERYIAEYFEDMDALNIRRADVYPRATEEVPQIVALIRGLVDRGHAYATPAGDVYFRVVSDPDYGKLSHRTLESMQAGARVEPDPAKEHPLDFALWKAAKPGEPSWSSFWGEGRPGWHVECSAMVLHHLGESIDIHGGGQDLIFPHHENEIAQSECFIARGEPFARYWLHNGLLQLGEAKMSKSLGNLVTIRESLAKHSADALRVFVLSSHYRSPLTFGEAGLTAAERGLDRLRLAAGGSAGGSSEPIDAEPHHRRFVEAMEDDLNTPQALAALFDLAREVNRGRDEGRDVAEAQRHLRELAGVLGLTLTESARERQDHREVQPFIELLIGLRADLRAAKQWALADRVREQLGALGVHLEDTSVGTTWRFKER